MLMKLHDIASAEDGVVRTFDYNDATTYAVDLNDDDGAVDVLEDTVIVVVGDDEYDVDVPEGTDVQAFIKNGVLTIEVSDT